ncbi:MAG: hypothetical protein Q9208_001461 [Pyrenodesmia sp. 3 TL-2023]
MADSQAGDIQWKNRSKFRQALGFDSSQDMYRFLYSRRFRPYFEAYARQWIWPQREESQRTGGARGRSSSLLAVEKRLLAGEALGRDKYSAPIPDTQGWDKLDFQALLMYQIKAANIKSSDGLFFQKDLSESEIHRRVWGLCKWAEFEEAPARERRPAKRTANVDQSAPGPSNAPSVAAKRKRRVQESSSEEEQLSSTSNEALHAAGLYNTRSRQQRRVKSRPLQAKRTTESNVLTRRSLLDEQSATESEDPQRRIRTRRPKQPSSLSLPPLAVTRTAELTGRPLRSPLEEGLSSDDESPVETDWELEQALRGNRRRTHLSPQLDPVDSRPSSPALTVGGFRQAAGTLTRNSSSSGVPALQPGSEGFVVPPDAVLVDLMTPSPPSSPRVKQEPTDITSNRAVGSTGHGDAVRSTRTEGKEQSPDPDMNGAIRQAMAHLTEVLIRSTEQKARK